MCVCVRACVRASVRLCREMSRVGRILYYVVMRAMERRGKPNRRLLDSVRADLRGGGLSEKEVYGRSQSSSYIDHASR